MFIERFDDAMEREVLALAQRLGLDPIRDRSKVIYFIFDVGLAFVASAVGLAEAQGLLSRQSKSSHEGAPGDCWVGRDPND